MSKMRMEDSKRRQPAMIYERKKQDLGIAGPVSSSCMYPGIVSHLLFT
jgi:hypothetical protein